MNEWTQVKGLTPFKAFVAHGALKLHLTSKKYQLHQRSITEYDYRAFEALKGRQYLFEKLSQLHDPFNYIVANMIENPLLYPNTFTDDRYLRRKKYLESGKMSFDEDLSKLNPEFASNFVGNAPKVVRLWFEGQIQVETLSILDQMGKFLLPLIENKKLPKEYKSKILIAHKYSSLMEEVKLDKYKAVVLKRFN